MNAPAQIRNRARDAYIPTVQALLPGCEGDELTLRCSILNMRDRATSHLRGCSEDAGPVLQTVELLATRYAFTSMPIEDLKALRYQMVRLVSCASGLEAFAWSYAGGSDAGD